MSFILAIILAVVVFGKIALDNSEKRAKIQAIYLCHAKQNYCAFY